MESRSEVWLSTRGSLTTFPVRPLFPHSARSFRPSALFIASQDLTSPLLSHRHLRSQHHLQCELQPADRLAPSLDEALDSFLIFISFRSLQGGENAIRIKVWPSGPTHGHSYVENGECFDFSPFLRSEQSRPDFIWSRAFSPCDFSVLQEHHHQQHRHTDLVSTWRPHRANIWEEETRVNELTSGDLLVSFLVSASRGEFVTTYLAISTSRSDAFIIIFLQLLPDQHHLLPQGQLPLPPSLVCS